MHELKWKREIGKMVPMISGIEQAGNCFRVCSSLSRTSNDCHGYRFQISIIPWRWPIFSRFFSFISYISFLCVCLSFQSSSFCSEWMKCSNPKMKRTDSWNSFPKMRRQEQEFQTKSLETNSQILFSRLWGSWTRHKNARHTKKRGFHLR